MESLKINLPESNKNEQSFSEDKVPKVSQGLNRKSISSPQAESTPN